MQNAALVPRVLAHDINPRERNALTVVTELSASPGTLSVPWGTGPCQLFFPSRTWEDEAVVRQCIGDFLVEYGPSFMHVHRQAFACS